MGEDPEGEQRWSHGRGSFVPPRDLFNPGRAEVALIPEAEARRFVTTHHYSRSFPASRIQVGLFQKAPLGEDHLVGVAVFGVGMQPRSVTKYLGLSPDAGVELSRFVLLDEVKFNAESWFIARAMRALREQLPAVRGVLAYSDPVPYTDTAGRVTKRGHLGTIYRATNARYCGMSLPRTVRLSPQGLVVPDRALSKIRTGEKGADYAYDDLLRLGAPSRRAEEDARAYVRRALEEGPFRAFRHPGKNVFTWRLPQG